MKKSIRFLIIVFAVLPLLACNLTNMLSTSKPPSVDLPSVTPTNAVEKPAETAKPTAVPTTVPQAPAQPDSAGGALDFCTLIAKSDVEKFFNEPASEPKASPGGCVFTNAKDSLYAFSFGAGQDKDASNVLQGQAMLLGMAGVRLDEAALAKLKPMADGLDFKGFFTEMVALSKSSSTINAQMLTGGGNDLTYWAWITVPPRRTGAFAAVRGNTVISLYVVVPESQKEETVLNEANNLAGAVFSKLPAKFSVSSAPPAAAPPAAPSQNQPPAAQPTPTLIPSSTPVQGLSAPALLTPAEGQVLTTYPRSTNFTWSPVPGAGKYFFELMACSNSNTSDCFVWPANKPTHEVFGTSYTFNFVGAQPGKWRVTAVDANGVKGASSEWRMFKYTK